MTDTSTVYTVETFVPDYRESEAVFTQRDGINVRRMGVIGWLIIVTAHDDTRKVVPAVLDGGQVVPARIACPAGWAIEFTEARLPALAVNALVEQLTR
jgi:hypothetical protein